MEPDLFTAAAEERQEKDPAGSPLAVRMRPRTLDEVVGQRHLLKPGSPLRRLVGEGGGGPAGPSSVILWGPPGIGKTTLAYVVSKATNKRFVELSAITAGVKEVRAVIDGARRALTALEAAAGGALAKGEREITLQTVEETVDRAAVTYDRDGDQHYDVASALIKSIRGSDVDAALHYLARMIEAGEDPRFIARRLMISASEDIGLADRQ
ncbi:AAA family ATPase, partial [Streptomyces sp. NPDC058757]|uniref:AAA family ATPase n=1 Tax=Streptomyces sp. NPDC058757 TaxID=3346626 RepID=UPI0036854723